MTSALATIRSLLASGALLALVAISAVMLVPSLFGYERYVILTGSMTGTYDTGSIVFAEPRPASALRVGDVITYAPPAGQAPTALVTHRIAQIRHDQFGDRVYRTKGDANAAVDPWQFKLAAATQPVVRHHVPYLGHAITTLSDRRVRMAVIGLPALLVAFAVLFNLAREARRERVTLA